MKEKFKKSLKYIFIFVFSLAILTFFSIYTNNWDALWNYEFSYSMAKGQIPYKEFTMIIPPFYNFLMSLGLLISHNHIIFLIEQALLITISFYFLFKMYDYKAWIILLIMNFPYFMSYSPTYNYFIYFLFIIILYLEKFKKNDYLIGFLIGLMILTKHTVGIFFIIPSIIIYFKDRKRLLDRFIGLMTPCLIFLIYLLFTNSLYEFLDLCLFGLIDFGTKNTYLGIWYVIASLIFLFISIFCTYKNPKKIINWYVLSSFSIMIPIFAEYHFYVYTLFMGILLIDNIPQYITRKYIINLVIFVTLFLIAFHCTQIYEYEKNSFKITRFKTMHNFNYYYGYKKALYDFSQTNKLYNKYRKLGDVYYFGNGGDSLLKIVNEEKTNYFTVLNKGNYGYNGADKLKRKIDKMSNSYFIINIGDYEYTKLKNAQFDDEIVEYVMDNTKLIKEYKKYNYKIYYKE